MNFFFLRKGRPAQGRSGGSRDGRKEEKERKDRGEKKMELNLLPPPKSALKAEVFQVCADGTIELFPQPPLIVHEVLQTISCLRSLKKEVAHEKREEVDTVAQLRAKFIGEIGAAMREMNLLNNALLYSRGTKWASKGKGKDDIFSCVSVASPEAPTAWRETQRSICADIRDSSFREAAQVFSRAIETDARRVINTGRFSSQVILSCASSGWSFLSGEAALAAATGHTARNASPHLHCASMSPLHPYLLCLPHNYSPSLYPPTARTLAPLVSRFSVSGSNLLNTPHLGLQLDPPMGHCSWDLLVTASLWQEEGAAGMGDKGVRFRGGSSATCRVSVDSTKKSRVALQEEKRGEVMENGVLEGAVKDDTQLLAARIVSEARKYTDSVLLEFAFAVLLKQSLQHTGEQQSFESPLTRPIVRQDGMPAPPSRVLVKKRSRGLSESEVTNFEEAAQTDSKYIDAGSARQTGPGFWTISQSTAPGHCIKVEGVIAFQFYCFEIALVQGGVNEATLSGVPTESEDQGLDTGTQRAGKLCRALSLKIEKLLERGPLPEDALQSLFCGLPGLLGGQGEEGDLAQSST